MWPGEAGCREVVIAALQSDSFHCTVHGHIHCAYVLDGQTYNVIQYMHRSMINVINVVARDEPRWTSLFTFHHTAESLYMHHIAVQ